MFYYSLWAPYVRHMSIHSLAFNSFLQTMLSEQIRWELLRPSDLLALTNEALNGTWTIEASCV